MTQINIPDSPELSRNAPYAFRYIVLPCNSSTRDAAERDSHSVFRPLLAVVLWGQTGQPTWAAEVVEAVVGVLGSQE